MASFMTKKEEVQIPSGSLRGGAAGSAFNFCRPICQDPTARRGKFSRSQHQVSRTKSGMTIDEGVRY
jgi:hypothetical protein